MPARFNWGLGGTPAFEYDPLPDPETHIRLLELLPGSASSIIKCRLTAVDRTAAAGTFEPLSYSWGEATEGEPILVNDCVAHARPSLHAALLQLRERKAEGPRLLWIDALCINQGDNGEKSVQVQMMRQVYESGRQTLIWLGEERQYETSVAFQILTFLADYAAAHPREQVDLKDWKKLRRLEQGKSEYRLRGAGWLWSAVSESQARDALLELFGRQWFTRVWIIQEVAVSKQAVVICGKQEVSWDVVQQAFEISRDSWQEKDLLETLIDERNKFQGGVTESLAAKVWTMCRSRATDPRDKIYGLLGLVIPDPSKEDVSVNVDYGSPPAELFGKVTRDHLELTNDIGILACGDGCRSSVEDTEPTPSWIWRTDTWPEDLDAWDMYAWDPVGANRGRFQASRTSAARIDFKDDDKVLGVLGYELDEIVEVGPAMDPQDKEIIAFEHLWPDVVHAFLHWRRIAGLDTEKKQYRDTDETVEDAFRKVIQPVVAQPPDDDELRSIFKRFEALLLKNFAFLQERETVEKVDWARCQPVFLQLAYKHKFSAGDAKVLDLQVKILGAENRRLVKSKTGYLGVAPRTTKVGDRIVLLAGARAPFVLRQASDERWKLVGDARIHGVMNGEAWDETRCDQLWIE